MKRHDWAENEMDKNSNEPEQSFERALDVASEPPNLPDCFIEWLGNYWFDNSHKEAERFWVETLYREWWTAALDLKCLAAVLRDPPSNLPDLVREHAGIALRNETRPGYFEHGTFDDYVKWLREVNEEFVRLFNQVTEQWREDTPEP